jgi:Lon protease-like protein
MVALPTELVPLHIFEERYKRLVDHCLQTRSEFGIVWMGDEGLHPIGCACEIAEVLERMPDGRLNLVARGTRPFRIESREEGLPYPAATVVFLEETPEAIDEQAAAEAHAAFSELLAEATDVEAQPEVASLTSYEMAAAVEFGPEAKQGLLDLRSETARLRLLSRLFRAALRRMEFIETSQERARSNGRIHFLPTRPE